MSGFVDDRSIELIETFAKPFAERSRLIGQRVTLHPAFGGRHSRLKGESAEMVRRAAVARGIAVDISTDGSDVLYGDDWYAFLGDCRFVLGAEGGMSLWDPYGEIRTRINAFVASHPGATFDEIESACFPGLDGQHMFIGFSPRILEAALLKCGLILVEGEYMGLLRPHEHYIPLRADGSNMDEVLAEIRDEDAAQRRIAATWRDLVQNPKLRYSHMVERVMDYVRRRRAAKRNGAAATASVDANRDRHFEQLADALIADAAARGVSGQELIDGVGEQLAANWGDPFRLFTAPPQSRSALCRAYAAERVRMLQPSEQPVQAELPSRDLSEAALAPSEPPPGDMRGRVRNRIARFLGVPR